MTYFSSVFRTQTIQCAALGLVLGILFSGVSFAGNSNPSAASSFNLFNMQNGNNWTSQWNNQTGYSQGVLTWGNGYKGRSNLPASVPHLFEPMYVDSGVCVKPITPTLSPVFVEDQKLSILSFTATQPIISEGNGYTNTTMFDMSFAIMHTDALEGQRHSNSDAESKVFYIVEQVIIKDSSNNTVAALYNTTYINPSNCIKQGDGNEDAGQISGNNEQEVEGKECEWIGTQAGIPFTTVGYKDGVYSYQLTAALYRESINNEQESDNDEQHHTKLITTAQTGAGTFIIDSTPPTITITAPPVNTVLNDSYPQITVNYHDNLSCIDTNTFKALLDYTDVTTLFVTTDTSASFKPPYALSDGVHNVGITIKDRAGNSVATQEDFSIFTGQNSGAYQGVIGFLQSLAPVFGYPADLHDLRLADYRANFSGTTYVYSMYEFDQYINGVQVIGGQLKIGVNIYYLPTAVLGNYYTTVTNVNTTPSISADTAKSIALSDLSVSEVTLNNILPTLKILPQGNSGKLVWEVLFISRKTLLSYIYLIDAQTGAIINKTNNVLNYYTGAGNVFIAPPYILNFTFWSLISLPNLFSSTGCLNGLYATVSSMHDLLNFLNCLPTGYNNGIIYNDMPDISYSPTNTLSETPSDVLTDMITAYYHVDLLATKLLHATGYQRNISSSVQQYCVESATQIKVYINSLGPDLGIPNFSDCLDDAGANMCGIGIGNGCHYNPSLVIKSFSPYITETVYLRDDFTRDPKVIYHEYGHTILYDKGIDPGVARIYGAYHEGFADTNAFFMTGDPEIGEWLVSPYMRDADNATFQPVWFASYVLVPTSSGVNFTYVSSDPHLIGEIYSGAMWDLRNRMMNTYDLSSDQVWWLDVNAADFIVENPNSNLDFSFIIQPLLTANEYEWYWAKVLYQSGLISYPIDPWHEIEGAFARHGVLQSTNVAIAIPEIGEGKSVDPTQSPINFTIYSGANTNAQLFFYNSDGSYCSSSGTISTDPSFYQSSTAYPGCSTIVPGYNQGCAVYNAASEISNCQNGKVTFAAQTCNGSNCISSASDGPPQYIYKIGGGCSIIPYYVNIPAPTIILNIMILFIPAIFVLYVKRRTNRGIYNISKYLLITLVLVVLIGCSKKSNNISSWQIISKMPEGKSNFVAVISPFSLTGSLSILIPIFDVSTSVEVGDIDTNGEFIAWYMLPSQSWLTNNSRRLFSSVIYQNRIYTYGGTDSVGFTNLTDYTSINPDETLGQWQTTSSMTLLRGNLSAVMCKGYAYALGGYYTGTSITNSVEYAQVMTDGTLGNWQYTSSMNLPRAAFAAVAISGWVYAVGGNTRTGATSTVEYTQIQSNSSLGSWQFTSPMHTARAGLAVTDYNGWLYAIGGDTNTVEMAQIKPDGTLGQWQFTTQMNKPRTDFSVIIVNNKIYAVGGDNQESKYNNTVEYANIYSDGTISSWQIITSTSFIYSHTSAIQYQQHIYLLGGSELESLVREPYPYTYKKIYLIGGNVPTTTTSITFADISGSTISKWSETTGLWEPRAGFSGIATDGFFYIVGGENNNNLNNFEVNVSLDPLGTLGKGIIINASQNIPAGSADVFACDIYVIGGKDNAGDLNSVTHAVSDLRIQSPNKSCSQFYTLTPVASKSLFVFPGLSFSWETGSPLNLPRYKLSAVSYNGYVYALGGYYTGTSITNSVEYAQVMTDGTLGNWQYTSSMNLPRAAFAAVAISGWVYAVGGYTDKGITNTVEKAPINPDGSLGKWVFIDPMTIPRAGLAVVEDNGWIYALGGISTPNGMPLDTIEAARMY